MEKRTVIEFDVNNDIRPEIEAWANNEGYKLKESEGHRLLFQKGTGFLVAPMMLGVSFDGSRVRFEAWARANLLVRAFALFLVPAEMGIRSGGFRLAVPRRIARQAVNRLLEKLGQPLVP